MIPARPFLLLLLILLCTSLFSSSLSTASDTLSLGSPLSDGDTIVSANGTFVLGFFAPNPNSNNRYVGIWYNKVSVRTYVWVANRNDPLVDPPGTLSLTANGTLLITTNDSTVVWSSSASSTIANRPVAQILENGNFVVKDVNDDSSFFAWQSFDHPTDTMLPGMKLGWNLTSGLNRNLTAWASPTDPSSGSYTLAMDVRGEPQLFLSSGSTHTWRSGPWNGDQFSGIPKTDTYSMFYSMFTYHFVQNLDEVYYMFRLKDPSIKAPVIVNQSGSAQHLTWLDQQKQWNVFWFAPKDQCDNISPCGPMGVCNIDESPEICDCVQGFVPKYPTNWTGGCIREMPLDCRDETDDGFVLLREMKLPDPSSSTVVDMSLSLAQCRVECLRNCSCTGYANAVVNGTGCIIWTTQLTDLRVWRDGGQDLYVRVAAAADLSRTTEQSHRSRKVAIIVTIPVILGTVLLLSVACFVRNMRRKKRAKFPNSTWSTNPYNYQDTDSKDLELPLFDLITVVAATDNFSTCNKLGEGSFGPVFMGTLEDGQQIAVKRLAKTSFQGTTEFRNEMELIAKLQHRNLVRLLGCCIHGDQEKMLIYEYMPNKSLDVFLFDRTKCALLDWQTRYEIIMGIARGVLYLHQDSRFRIIHRDLKANNILLDKDMNPKISDFGMARIFGEDETQANTRKVVGTYGYMSPEYAMDGVFSVKSDVFSFGVLVLEIISGKKNKGVYFANDDLNLQGHAWRLWNEGTSLDLVDDSVSPKYSANEALRCIKVGLLCVQERPEDRPTMSSVVLMLGSENALLPQPKQPGFILTKGPFEYNSPSRKQTSYSVNDISITMCEGR